MSSGVLDRQTAVCRHCHFPIFRLGDGRPWFHKVGIRAVRGCRAATFDRDGDWDDTFPRHWTADP